MPKGKTANTIYCPPPIRSVNPLTAALMVAEVCLTTSGPLVVPPEENLRSFPPHWQIRVEVYPGKILPPPPILIARMPDRHNAARSPLSHFPMIPIGSQACYTGLSFSQDIP